MYEVATPAWASIVFYAGCAGLVVGIFLGLTGKEKIGHKVLFASAALVFIGGFGGHIPF